MQKNRKKTLIGSITILGIMLGIGHTSAQFSNLPLNNILSGYTQYSSIFYHFGGNSFGGMIFLSGFTTISGGTNIFINGNTQSVNCTYQINGLYYNNLRGFMLWPLDTGNLQVLIANDRAYTGVVINGGLFTNCTGAGAKSDEIYGEVKHKGGGLDYTITAGLGIDTVGNRLVTPRGFSGSLKIASGSIQGLLFDNIGQVGEAGPVSTVTTGGSTIVIGGSQGSVGAQCQSFKVVSVTGTAVSLSCSGSNVNDYVLRLIESSGGKIAMATNGATSPYPWTISIPTGNYVASCTANIGNSTCNQIAISNLSGELFISEIGSGQIISSISATNGISAIRSARLKTEYTSENIVVSGLTTGTIATITNGDLSINGTSVGRTGYVKNGDILNITLKSASDYNTTESSIIFIGGMFETFSVITMDNDGDQCNLGKTEKLKVAQMFEFIKDGYEDSSNKRINMLYVLKSMIQDVQGFDYNCSLQYLMDLTDNEIEDDDTEDETSHTAPNCKEYPIVYDEEDDSYTSSKFKKEQLFASREALIKFIDSQNPGDCHINIYTNEQFDYEDTDTTHVAPNGKIYTIEESYDGYFSSPTMSVEKQFDTRDGLIEYIDKYNPEFPIRDHEVDDSRGPITYVTANNKEYNIYKTDKGYMSYRLLKVKYFDDKDAIIEYIDQNNR